MFVSILLVLCLSYKVFPHKYYVERDQKNSEDLIHLQLEGVSGSKCSVNLLEKNELFYHYINGVSNDEKLESVPCVGKYTISTGTAYPIYYVQVKSKYGTETLKIIHITDSAPETQFKLNSTSIEFTTRNMCSHPQACKLTSGDKILAQSNPTANSDCNDETKLTGFFDSIDQSLELSCGINQPKIYMFRKNNQLMEFNTLDQYPFHIVNVETNKINIIFDEAINDEICKFQIKKKDGNYESKCSVKDDTTNCYQLCTNATMEIEFTAETNKDFIVKISQRNDIEIERNIRIGKSNLQVTPAITSAALSIATLKDSTKTTTCVIELKNQAFPKNSILPKCSADLQTACSKDCTDTTIYGLEPNTKYIVKVTYTETAGSLSYTAEKLFKTNDHAMTEKPEIKAYYEHVKVTVAPNDTLLNGVYCTIQQKIEAENVFSPSECEESIDCSGLCGLPLTIKNLLPETLYEFKYSFSKYISDSDKNVIKVTTTPKLEKLTVTYSWKETDLIVTTKTEQQNSEQICDFTFAEIIDDFVKYTYALFDKNTGWEGKCNQEITFFNAVSYKSGSMKVQARYTSEPLIVNLNDADTENKENQDRLDDAEHGHSNAANVGGTKIMLIVGGVLMALLVCAIVFLVLTKK